MNSKISKDESETEYRAKMKQLWQSARSLLFFFLLLYLIPQIENWIGQDRIKNFLDSVGIFAPITFILVRILTVMIAPLRLGPITMIMHRAFGLWTSIFYTVIVVTVGSFLNYLIGKKWGNQIIGFFFGSDILNIIDKYAQQYLDRDIKTTTLLFLSNFELVGYATGLTSIRRWKVLLTSFLSSLVTAPLLVVRDLSIGVNDFLATSLFILGYFISLGPILYLGKDDIKKWWKEEMDRINRQVG